jgi:hypothetical protein
MAMRAVHKRYLREFIPAILIYMLLVYLSVRWLRSVDGTVARAAVTLLPVLPIAFIIRAMVRAIRGQDELERRTDLESISIGGAIGGFGFFSYGMLINAGVLQAPPAQSVAIWVLPVLMFGYGAVKCCMTFYYRVR